MSAGKDTKIFGGLGSISLHDLIQLLGMNGRTATLVLGRQGRKGKIYFKEGNHEERYTHFMHNKGKELIGLPDFELENVMECEQYNVTYIAGRRKIVAGALNIVHGHEFGRSVFNPVNPARGLFLRSKTNVLGGHYHQSSAHYENNLDGDQIACWSTGCLCDLSPEYAPFGYTKWNHGAAIVDIDSDGAFSVDNFRVIKGRVRR